MSARLPVEIDPENLIEKRSELKGMLPLSGFDRLLELLIDDKGAAGIVVSFRKEGDIKAILGYVNATLLIQCQRCLEPITLLVEKDIRLAVVGSDEQAKRLSDYYDPLLLDSQQIVLSELIEDELILAIPDIPMHDDCQAEELTFSEDDFDEQIEPNPFAILAKLRSKEK